MLEATHHQADSRGQTDEDDGEADHHGHLDVHLHHAVDVSDRTAGRPAADGVIQRILRSGTLEIFLEFYLQLLWSLMPFPTKVQNENEIVSDTECEMELKLKYDLMQL